MRRKIKILLVLEEYQDLTEVQSLLMKYGWDVKSVKRDFLVKEEVFTFRPELIIASGKGRVIDGISLAKNLERKDGNPKFALYLDRQQVLNQTRQELGVDEIIPKPFEPLILLKMVCELTGVDEKVILEKYKKLNPDSSASRVSEDEEQVFKGEKTEQEENQFVSGRPATHDDRDWIHDSARSEKYNQLAALVKEADLSPWISSPVDETIQALHEKFANEYQDQDKMRQDFVEALFKD